MVQKKRPINESNFGKRNFCIFSWQKQVIHLFDSLDLFLVFHFILI